jgi:hypothetical protein
MAPDAAGSDDPVAVQYHFAGTTNLAANTNFTLAGKLLGLPSSVAFRNLVLNKWAGIFWRDLQFKSGADPVAGLRPLMDDLLNVESVASFGGASKDRVEFVLAAHLDKTRTPVWQQSLAAALGGAGVPFQTDGFSGMRWDLPGNSPFWTLQARDWFVVGRGDSLKAARADYLRQIKKSGRPRPALTETWLKADINWPLVDAFTPLDSCPFKLARTSFDVTSGGGRFRVAGFITYPGEVKWQASPWQFPKDLVHEPLLSFTAGRDVGAYLKSGSAVPRVVSAPFTNQFTSWAQARLPFQTYAAWPVPNGTDAINKLAQEALPDLNSLLTHPREPKLTWHPSAETIVWLKSSLVAPDISAVRGQAGDYLVAKLFPLSDENRPAPAGLWSQFEGRDDLIFYDWEFTGPRLQQWRLLSELLPVLPAVSAPTTNARGAKPAYVIIDDWLAGLTPFLANTATEIKRNSPGELSFTRSTPFVFTSFELLWLSHWLTDTPSGPVNFSMLPMAKMSGPGVPKH